MLQRDVEGHGNPLPLTNLGENMPRRALAVKAYPSLVQSSCRVEWRRLAARELLVWYNDPLLDGTRRELGEATPVWSIMPEPLMLRSWSHPAAEWQRSSKIWTPTQRDAVVLEAGAEGVNGLVQPISGRRNANHDLSVNVV